MKIIKKLLFALLCQKVVSETYVAADINKLSFYSTQMLILVAIFKPDGTWGYILGV